MSDIFISYSRKDLAIVSRLASALEERGYSVWRDVRGLHGGQAFASVIKVEIDKARCAIVVWSKASVVSEWVHAEASHANNRKPSILLTTVYQDADIPLPFNTRHNEDLRGWKGDPFDPKFQKLLLAVMSYCPHPSNPQGRKKQNVGGKTAVLGGVQRLAAAGLMGGVIVAGAFLYLHLEQIVTIPVPEPPVEQPTLLVGRYQLAVNTTPKNAVITVDGNIYDPGETWKPGTYAVKASADGYWPSEKTVVIKNRDAQLSFELEAIRYGN